jgi:hypothetical protein
MKPVLSATGGAVIEHVPDNLDLAPARFSTSTAASWPGATNPMGSCAGGKTARNILARWTIDLALSEGASVSYAYNKNLAAVGAMNPEKESLQ